MSVRVNSELGFFRVIVNTAGTTHNILGALASKGTLPLATTKTGTITSTPGSTGTENKKAVVGTGTLFRTEVREGDYIYAGDVLRKVVSISTNTLLFVEFPFPATVTGAALKICQSGKYKTITATTTGSANAIYNEVALEPDKSVYRTNEMGLAPISYDCSGANAELTFDLSE